MLSQKTRYALKALLELSALPPGGAELHATDFYLEQARAIADGSIEMCIRDRVD